MRVMGAGTAYLRNGYEHYYRLFLVAGKRRIAGYARFSSRSSCCIILYRDKIKQLLFIKRARNERYHNSGACLFSYENNNIRKHRDCSHFHYFIQQTDLQRSYLNKEIIGNWFLHIFGSHTFVIMLHVCACSLTSHIKYPIT